MRLYKCLIFGHYAPEKNDSAIFPAFFLALVLLLGSGYNKKKETYPISLDNYMKIQHNKIGEWTEEDWIELECFMNRYHRGFMKRLRKKHPSLKENDYQVCMLLKMRWANLALAQFYSISTSSVKQKLSRLKNKLSIADSEISAREYIESFS